MKGCASSRTVSDPERENISVLFATSAHGDKLPPLIIFKGKNTWDRWVQIDGDFPNTAYGITQNGWMEALLCISYFKKTFIKYVPSNRPILFIYDGHSIYLHLNIILKAIKNNITILKLPPHSNHILHPLDLWTFKSLKVKWDAKLVTWQRKNIGKKLPKAEFSKIIGNVWSDVSADILKEDFKKGGIIPFNKNCVSEDKFDPNALKKLKINCAQCNNNNKITTEKYSGSECLSDRIDQPSTSKVLTFIFFDT